MVTKQAAALIFISILCSLLLSGCIGIVGGKCEYRSLKTHAVVKEIDGENVLLEFSSKALFPDHANHQQEFSNIPRVHIGEILPASIDSISHGSCKPTTYSIDRPNYFLIKGFPVYFSNEGIIEDDADAKAKIVIHHYLELKRQHPDAILTLHALTAKKPGNNQQRPTESRYINAVLTTLNRNGLSYESIYAAPTSASSVTHASDSQQKHAVIFGVDFTAYP